MTPINIQDIDVNRDSKRFKQLVSQGILPSTAIRRIVDEHKAINRPTIKPKSTNYVLPIAIAGILLTLVYSIATKSNTTAAMTMSSGWNPMTEKDIKEIDKFINQF